MFTEIVTFRLPDGMERAEVVAYFEKTAPVWGENADLVRKYYLFDDAGRRGGGVYLWREREAAARWHGEAFRAKVREVFGAEPEITLYETPIVVDNVAGTIRGIEG